MAAVLNDTREFDWTIEQGERERITIPVLDADDNPYAVDGWSVDACIKTRPGGALLYRWPANLINVAGPQIELVVPGPVSARWTWTEGWWRVVITAPNGPQDDPDTYRIIQGRLCVLPD